MTKVAIVGAGLGGLAAAITLANSGVEVTIYEKNDHIGGKMMPVSLGNYTFDFGPNTITMPFVFQQIIAQTGRNPDDYFEFIQLDKHTENISVEGERFYFSNDENFMVEQLETIDPEGAKNYPSFIREITRLYKLAEKHFFEARFEKISDYVSPSLGLAMLQVRPFESLHHFFRRYFKNPFVVQAFDRYATYIGSSPYETPATFAMIAYLELVKGVYTVKGGNVRIAEAFYTIARELGVNMQTGRQVSKIALQNQQVIGVEIEEEGFEPFDMVIVNGDLLDAYPKLVEEQYRPAFKNEKIEKFDPSISAFVLLVGINERTNLAHHTVYFSGDYMEEFQALTSYQYAENPTVYICNPAATEPQRFPDGDALFILANAPAQMKLASQTNVEAYTSIVFNQLKKAGLNLNGKIEVVDCWTPERISDKFGAYKGALYGPSSNTKKQSFFRPSTVSKDIKGLYFVGGSTHPGGGSPMVTMSGYNVAKQLLQQKIKYNV